MSNSPHIIGKEEIKEQLKQYIYDAFNLIKDEQSTQNLEEIIKKQQEALDKCL